jgi:Na+/H+ antiporter NhaC
VEALLAGVAATAGLALLLGLLRPAQLFFVDHARFSARGLVVEGLERGVGVSVFTILLIGLVATLQATDALPRLIAFARRRASGPQAAEGWIFGAVSGAVLLTTHSVVAILAVGEFARETGARFGLGPYRRANLLDVTVCTYPFLLPYFLPPILAASASASGAAFGMPRVTPFRAGALNFYSWLLLAVVLAAITTGYGRGEDGRSR